jgi:hypothetical protein
VSRGASDRHATGKQPCRFCRGLWVLAFASLVVMFMAYVDKLIWLQNMHVTDIFAYAIVLTFFVVLVFKLWIEYLHPKRVAQQRKLRRKAMYKLFDEMDASIAQQTGMTEAVQPDADNTAIAQGVSKAQHLVVNGENTDGVESVEPPQQLDIFDCDIKK